MGDTSPEQDVVIKEETPSEDGNLEITQVQGSACSRDEAVVSVQPNVGGRGSRLTKVDTRKSSTEEDRGGDGDGSDGTVKTLPVPGEKASKAKRKNTDERKRKNREQQRRRRQMMSDEERRADRAKRQQWRKAATEKLLKKYMEEKMGNLEENEKIEKSLEEIRFQRNMKQYLRRQARWANKELKTKDQLESSLRKSAKRLEETPEEREKRLEKQRQKYKMTRANMTQEQTERYRESVRRCQERRTQLVQVRYSELPEAKKERIRKNFREKIKNETPEQRKQRLARYKRYQTRRRELVRLQEEEEMTKDEAEQRLRSTRPDLFTAAQLSTGTLRVSQRKGVTGSCKPYKPNSKPGGSRGRPPRNPDEVLEFMAALKQKKRASHARVPDNTDKSISSSQEGSADADDNAKATVHESTSCTIVSKPVQESIDAPELRKALLKKESKLQRPVSLPSYSCEDLGQVAAEELAHRKPQPKVYCDSSKKVKKVGKKMQDGNLMPVELVSSTSASMASSIIQSTSLDQLEKEKKLVDSQERTDSQVYENSKTSKKTSPVPAWDKTTASATIMDCATSEDSVMKSSESSPHASPDHSFQDDLMDFSTEDDGCDQCSDSEEECNATSVHPIDLEINSNLGNQNPSSSSGSDKEFEIVEAKTQTTSDQPSNQQRENYCELCKKQLLSERVYRIHMEAKHSFSIDTNQSIEPRKFLCPFQNCLKTFDHSQYLWHHYMRCHNDIASYDPNSRKQKQQQVESDPDIGLCPHCGKNYFDWYGVVRHIKLVHEKIESTFVCEHCVKTFRRKCTLDDHVRREHLGMDNACDTCGKKFQSTAKLWRHKVKIHNMEALDPTSLGSLQMQQCLYCGIQMFRGMKPHVEKEHPEHLDEYLMALQIERREKWKMRKCTNRIRKKGKSTKKGKSNYPCTVCNHSFTRDWNLELHKRRVHPESLPAEIKANVVSCAKCKRTFAARNGLILHILHNHCRVTKLSLNGVPDLEIGEPRCQFCTFVISDKVMYKLHILTEHAEDFLQLFKQKLDQEISKQVKCRNCPYCEITTMTDREMLVHIRKIHPETHEEYCSPITIQINKKRRLVALKGIGKGTSKSPNNGKRKRRHQEPRKVEQPVVKHEDVKKEDCSIDSTLLPVRRSTRRRTLKRQFVDNDSDEPLESAYEDVPDKPLRRNVGRSITRKTSPPKETLKRKHLTKKELPQPQLRTTPSSSFGDIIRKKFKHLAWREPVVVLKRLTMDEILQYSPLESR